MQYVIAFVTGGMICALSQILMEKKKCFAGRIMVLLVCLGGPSLDLWGSMSRFPNGRRRVRMCRFWDLETISGRVSKRWWTRKDLSVFFLGGFKNCAGRAFHAKHSFFFLYCLPALPAKDEKALANLENSVV